MEISSLALARVLMAAAIVSAAAGCHGSSASGNPMDAAVEVTPDLSEKLPTPDAYCAPDAMGGNGVCPINFCGAPKVVASLQAGEMAELGADVKCTPGYVCVPDAPTPAGDAIQLRCVQPLAPAATLGAACGTGASAPARCKNDALCIKSPDFPDQPFCSALCRADADCPTDSYCIEYATEPLPKGSFVKMGYCTPKAKIKSTICTNEAGCPAGQGCVSYGPRTALLVCKAGGNKSLGDACTGPAQCRSGECLDRDFKASNGRTYCTGHCKKSSDCGPDQRCARIVLGNNGTPADPFDDVVAGYCQTLFTPSMNDACKNDAECTTGGADTCDKTHGLCYKAGAVSGAPCTADTGCALGATCATQAQQYPGGYCQTFGCAQGAAAGSVDSCPGAKDSCSRRFLDDPLNTCYEGCANGSGCTRSSENYICSPATSAAGAPPTICLYSQGV